MGVFVSGIVGCNAGDPPSGPSSADIKQKDPYEGMSKEEKIAQIQNDPKINSMEKQSMIEKIKGQ